MNIVIVSIYGRGDWLAFMLSRLGYSVILIELDSGLNFEDIEGPFGVFQSKLLESFSDRLENESPLIHVDNGFAIWLKDSIYEFRGPISKFQFSKIDKNIINYLNDPLNTSLEAEFDKSWLAHLSCQLSSTIFRENADCLNHGDPVPMFSPFYYRLTTRRGVVDFKNKLKGLGVEVYNSIEDFNISSRTVNLKNTTIEYKNLIWMLTSSETDYFLPKLRNKIFKQVIKPVWYWVRYNISFSTQVFDALPSHFVNIEDIYIPWSHENLMILQKTITNNHMNCWLRLPSSYDDKKYKDYSLKIKKVLENKTNNEIKITSIPQKTKVFPVYDQKMSFKSDILIDSPETWNSLSWNGQCMSNEKTLNAIKEDMGQNAE